jgi:hypothetical protein
MHFQRLAPLALLVLVVLFVFAPLLFFGKAFSGEEQMGFYYAISYWVHESLRNGVPLLWQGGYYGGVSASLDQFVGAWYPLNLFLFSVFGFFTAHHVSIVIATTLGLLFSYWFGRVQGWGKISSLVLALSYLSATTFAWLQIGTIAAHSFMILPALLTALWYAAYARNYRTYWLAVVFGGLALGVGFLSGFMQIVFYDFCIASAYALFLDWNTYQKSLVWYRRCSASLGYAGMTMVGFGIGIWQFFPSAYLIDLTIRTNTYAIQNAYHPFVTQFVTLFLPPYIDIPFFGGGGSSGFYVGALGLVFALLGLTYYRTRTVMLFAGLYALMLGISFHLPVLGWLNEHVPPFSHMGGNFRWMVGAAFPLAYLAAAGTEGFLTAPERLSSRAWRLILWGTGLITGVLLLGSLLFGAVVRSVVASPEWIERLIKWYTDGRTLLHAPEHYTMIFVQSLQQVANLFSLVSGRFLFGVSLWILTFVFFIYYSKWGRGRRFASYAIGILMLVTVLGTYALQWDMLVPQSLYDTKPALVTLLQGREADSSTYRILGYGIGDGLFDKINSKETLTAEQTTKLQLDLLINNSNLYWGIERMDGMEPYRTLRANQLLNTVLSYDTTAYVFDDASPSLMTSPLDQLYNRDVQKMVTLPEKLKDFAKRLPLLSMMNVKYVYSLYPLAGPSLALTETISVTAGRNTLPVYLYENKKVLPRVYVVVHPKFFTGSTNEVLSHLLAIPDFSKQTLIECPDCANVSSSGSVSVENYKPGEVSLSVTTSAGAWVVFGESNTPGWVATIDGKETRIYPANYLFQAVYVPSGRHQVSFVYNDVTMLRLGSLAEVNI